MTQLFRLRRIAYALGAEVTDIDLRKPLDFSTVTRLREAWLEHLVLFFPNQELECRELLAFAQKFGDPESGCDSDAKMQTSPEVQPSARWDGYKDGHNWHSDKSFTSHPTTATILHCKSTPPIGGDTMFANMYMAYDALSATMRTILDGLSAVHVRELPLRPMYQKKGDTDHVRDQIRRAEVQNAMDGEAASHPAVRIHPESGRKALFLGTRVRNFVGMTVEESKPLLDFLARHCTSYEFTYRHMWRVNEVAVWDNRCLQHIALCDYDVETDQRHMVRCVIAGPEAGSVVALDRD